MSNSIFIGGFPEGQDGGKGPYCDNAGRPNSAADAARLLPTRDFQEEIAGLARWPCMFVFLDFEASSLSDQSYPIEVGWVFEDGKTESHLIRPAPDWSEWDSEAEAIHRISREELLAKGSEHAFVAQRMVDVLTGHDLCASAPSWDGKWLSALLRAAGLPRKALRLRDTDDVLRDAARAILAPVAPPGSLDKCIAELVTLTDIRQDRSPPVHRALADAERERQRWIEMLAAARAVARKWQAAGTNAALR